MLRRLLSWHFIPIWQGKVALNLPYYHKISPMIKMLTCLDCHSRILFATFLSLIWPPSLSYRQLFSSSPLLAPFVNPLPVKALPGDDVITGVPDRLTGFPDFCRTFCFSMFSALWKSITKTFRIKLHDRRTKPINHRYKCHRNCLQLSTLQTCGRSWDEMKFNYEKVEHRRLQTLARMRI